MSAGGRDERSQRAYTLSLKVYRVLAGNASCICNFFQYIFSDNIIAQNSPPRAHRGVNGAFWGVNGKNRDCKGAGCLLYSCCKKFGKGGLGCASDRNL